MSSLYVKATLVLPGSYSTKRYILFITALQRIIYHEQIVGKNKWSNCCDYSRFGQRHAIINKIRDAFETYELPSQVRIYSVHKQASELIQVLKSYNTFTFPLVIVGVASGTDALSGIASSHSAFPVLSCPSDGINATCLTNPPGSSNAFIKKTENVAKFAAQLFNVHDKSIKRKILSINKKSQKFEEADFQLNNP